MDTMKKGLCCPFTGAYIPRLLLCAVVGFLFICGFNYGVHNHLLTPIYQQTPQLWRTVEDMNTYFGFMMLMHFLTAFITAAIYTKAHEGKGVLEGLRYGVLLGLLMGVMMGESYAWMPISADLAWAWFFVGLVQGIGLGIIYSLLYKTPCCAKNSCSTDGSKTA